MKKLIFAFTFLFFVNVFSAECSFTSGLTTVSASFYWNYNNDGCWVTSSDFTSTKTQLSDGMRCSLNLKAQSEPPYGMGDIIYHSSCGYGSHPNYPTANNVVKMILNGSDGIPSYRAKITPSSTQAERFANIAINDLNTNTCSEGSYYEYSYYSLNDATESGASTTTEVKTISGCYTYSLYNVMWNLYFFKNIDKKELRYIFFNGQLIPVYLWIDTETLGTDVYKQFTIYLPKFETGGGDSKAIEMGEKEVQKIIDDSGFETVPDVLEENIGKYSVTLKVSDEYDKTLKEIFVNTSKNDEGNFSNISTIINESAEFRGFLIEKSGFDLRNSEFAKIIEGKIILSVNGFKANAFKNEWDMVDYILSNKINEITASDRLIEEDKF